MKVPNKIVVAGSLVMVVMTAVAGIKPTAAADAAFKNLQVLPKTISKEELKTYMKAQSKALGVECDFCHDVPDMASDKNDKKQIARKMIQMTNDVNDKWLKGMKDADKNKVTCATCHQGHEVPPKQAVAAPPK